ncbi:unnamed protein product [Coffea canephora]|uniref:Uncharacterized protein n=1 Tax=Coffea canephora TaxID=49390 RepID=A0A068UEC7_COFCA|nr:unnamed protein product [Coffea canephora]
MDLKSKGRTWVGNIYHKFEAICQEVDDFVNKDTSKYVENEVQTVGESVNKICPNVVHDFHPYLEDNKQAKAQGGTRTQNDVERTSFKSRVAFKEKHRHVSEKKSSKEQDRFDVKGCDPNEVDHLGQFSPPPASDSAQVAEKDSHWKETSDAAICSNTELVLQENVRWEDYSASSYLNFPRAEYSSKLPLCPRDNLLIDNLESPVDGILYGPSEISNEEYLRNSILDEFSSRIFVQGVGLRTSEMDRMTCNSTDLSKESETGLFLEQDGESTIYKKLEIGAEENAKVKEHHASELASSLEGKNSWELLWTQEQHPVGLEDKNSSFRPSADEDHKIPDLEKCSPETLVPNTVLRVVPVKQVADDNAEPADEAVVNLSSQHDDHVEFIKCGTGLEANVRKEHLVVDNRGYLSHESSSDLSLHPREKHPDAEDSNLLQDKSLYKSLPISTNEDYWSTIPAKLSPETSVNDEILRPFQQKEGECNSPQCSNETKTDLSLDCYRSCMSSDFSFDKNCLVEKHASSEHLRFPECSRKLHVETDELSSLNSGYSSGLSLIYRTEDHRNTMPTKMSPVNSVNDVGLSASQKDKTMCNNLSDVLSTNPSSELVSSGISWKHKLAETEASSSSMSTELLDPPEFSHGNCTKKTEEVCCEYTDSGGCASTLSSSSCASLFGLTSSNKDVNLVPAFPGTSSSADSSSTDKSMLDSFGNKLQQSFEGIVDDSVSDISDADMETIDLSDKAKLEESCVIVDNELLYAASCRPRKFRSYKKLIQEAFASRKRIIKEYEQLSIWYGDIDSDTSFHSDQHLSPHMKSASRPSQARDLGESEWELL